jgi:ABC-type transport system involved in cytochrome bd biosynthesis fused ATPase/permease subunit
LWHLAAPTFVPAGFCQLITVFAQITMPLLVRQLLQILEENPGATVVKEGMPYSVFIFVAALINAFGNHRHRQLATQTGIVLRASIVSVIYDDVLHLNPEGRAGLTSGQVTTLVAVDTQKVSTILLFPS